MKAPMSSKLRSVHAPPGAVELTTIGSKLNSHKKQTPRPRFCATNSQGKPNANPRTHTRRYEPAGRCHPHWEPANSEDGVFLRIDGRILRNLCSAAGIITQQGLVLQVQLASLSQAIGSPRKQFF
jgi:hypothetical protein